MRLTTATMVFLMFGLTAGLRAQNRESFSLTGRVQTGGRRAITDVVRIHLEGSRGFARDQSTSDGRFVFEGLSAGSYTVHASSEGFEDATLQVVVPVEDDVTVVLLRSTMVTPNGSPLISAFDFAIPRIARKEFEAGQQAAQKGDCSKALDHLQKATGMFEQYAQAHNATGNCFVKIGSLGRAEESFKKAVGLTADVYPALNLADLYAKQGRYPEAEDVLNAAVRRNPAAGNGYYGFAVLRFHQERYDDAAAFAVQAHEHAGHVADTHLLLAKIYQRTGTADAVRRELTTFVREAKPGEMRTKVQQLLKNWKKP